MSAWAPAVSIPRTIFEAIVAHAREGKPEEICGILRGRGTVAFELIRARNIAEERIENYTVDPQTLLLQFEFEDSGDEMMGIYHSHPVSVAYPSATDAWNANYPDAVYLICSLEDDAAPVVRAWRLVAESVDLDWGEVRERAPFREVRSGLFGCFQQDATLAPAVLARAAGIEPYYLVYQRDEEGEIVDERLVSVRECPLHITE
jgi:proteasome lid subunit RPN8/RPN11